MKIDGRYLTVTGIEHAVSLDRAEQSEVREIAVTFAETPFHVLSAVCQATAYEIIRLHAAYEWTAGDSERQRSEQLRAATLAYFAARMAQARR